MNDFENAFDNDRFSEKHKKRYGSEIFDGHGESDGEICGKSDTDIPRCLDWRNHKGQNYDTPIKR
jgi:hypothetical protein